MKRLDRLLWHQGRVSLELWRLRARFAPAAFFKFWLSHILLDPLFRQTKRRPVWTFRLRGYDEPFLARLGSSDLECLLEVILGDEYADAIPAGTHAPFIFDAGGNVGYAARYFLREFPDATILSVEPDAGNLTLLRRNLALACHPERCHVVHGFVAAAAGPMHLDRGKLEWGYRMTPGASPSGESIPARTVDGILAEAALDGRPIDLFKCDIEGAEADLFRTPGDWLHRVRALVVETHLPYHPDQLQADLARAGVKMACEFRCGVVFGRRVD